LNAYYLGYFACFNQELFYEAHDVLEEMWLPVKREAAGDFYKGLIQLAGAFVHLQKNRLRPSAALFKLARTNLSKYPSPPVPLDSAFALLLIEEWLEQLEKHEFTRNPLSKDNAPKLPMPG
jgi:predicted metal-dependent hydrolase